VGRGLHQVGSWSLARVLHEFERYNGMGYRRMGKATPYLWSFSNLYEKGRYVREHEYDPEAVSKQCGAALMIKTLVDQGETI
jgi:lysozyme family protein